MPGEIKYRFALNDSGQAVDIFSLKSCTDTEGRLFQCIACNERMVARLGQKTTHHFAHMPNGNCSGETYLHKLAKKIFEQEYKICLAGRKPFEVELEQRWVCNKYPGYSENTCHSKLKPQKHDLTKYYRKLRVEAEKDEFRPDIALECQDESCGIWIEIFVSHKCSAAKLNSKKRIVEVSIQSEEDLEIIKGHLFSTKDKRIRLFNFKKDRPKDMCSWFRYCNLEKQILVMYEGGDWDVLNLQKDEKNSPKASKVIIYEIESLVDARKHQGYISYEYDLQSAAKKAIFSALEAGLVIKACGFCEHFDSTGAPECILLKDSGPWKRAVHCENFSLAEYDNLIAVTSD